MTEYIFKLDWLIKQLMISASKLEPIELKMRHHPALVRLNSGDEFQIEVTDSLTYKCTLLDAPLLVDQKEMIIIFVAEILTAGQGRPC